MPHPVDIHMHYFFGFCKLYSPSQVINNLLLDFFSGSVLARVEVSECLVMKFTAAMLRIWTGKSREILVSATSQGWKATRVLTHFL